MRISKITSAAAVLIGLTLSGCQTSGLDKEVARAHGLSPDTPIEAKSGGCRPELESLSSSDGIDFVSGGTKCFVTKVINSPILASNETADLEILFFHGDGSPGSRDNALTLMEDRIRSTVTNSPLFLKNKVRYRLVARTGFRISGGGKTTGHTMQYQTHSYTAESAESIALLLAELDRQGSSKKFVVRGRSGGAQEIANAITLHGSKLPESLDTAIIKAGWGTIQEAMSLTGWPFTNAVYPGEYAANIPDNLKVKIANSKNDSVTGWRGGKDLYEKFKAAGKRVSFHLYEGVSHTEIATHPLVLEENLYETMRRILDSDKDR